MTNHKGENTTIKNLISCKNTVDGYYLDDNNAIIVTIGENAKYNMLHIRLVNGKLAIINRWVTNNYHIGFIHDLAVIKDLNLFQIQNDEGSFNALYNYIEGKFIVPLNTWKEIDAGKGNSILKKYNGFLAHFEIQSDYEEDDEYSYINPITGERIFESFTVKDDTYYAIINIDGTIRGNKLFKGKSFSKITEIIDLDKFQSIDEFKSERTQACNSQKQDNKQKYQELLAYRNDGSISPYLDSEVSKVLNLKN